MERKSNGFLKVTGILMIIGGGLGIIFGIIAMLGIGVAAMLQADVARATLEAVFVLVSAAMSLATGILGVVNAAKPERATVCIVFGILTVILTILGNILIDSEHKVLSLIIGLILPALYLIGAFQNKRKATAAS